MELFIRKLIEGILILKIEVALLGFSFDPMHCEFSNYLYDFPHINMFIIFPLRFKSILAYVIKYYYELRSFSSFALV